jgi:hypothetical protein
MTDASCRIFAGLSKNVFSPEAWNPATSIHNPASRIQQPASRIQHHPNIPHQIFVLQGALPNFNPFTIIYNEFLNGLSWVF